MTPSTRKKGIVTSLGVLTAVATLLSGGVTTAYANDALANPNSAMGYPSFKGPPTRFRAPASLSILDKLPQAGVRCGCCQRCRNRHRTRLLDRQDADAHRHRTKRYRHQRCWRLQLCGRRQQRISVLTWPCRIHVHAYAGSTWFRGRCRILGSDRQ